jgi:hypothetical protein
MVKPSLEELKTRLAALVETYELHFASSPDPHMTSTILNLAIDDVTSILKAIRQKATINDK